MKYQGEPIKRRGRKKEAAEIIEITNRQQHSSHH